MSRPDVVEDLEEMGHEYALADGHSWQRNEIAAIMILAAQEIIRAREERDELRKWLDPIKYSHRQTRAEALEEAALLCRAGSDEQAAIRALKDKAHD